MATTLDPEATTRLTLSRLESHLRGAAGILRGSIDSADYKHYIFGLLFFKRLSDVWQEEFDDRLRRADVEPDMLGQAYEYVIVQFADDAGKKGGDDEDWGRDLWSKGDRWGRDRYGRPPRSYGDLAFVQHMIAALATDGISPSSPTASSSAAAARGRSARECS